MVEKTAKYVLRALALHLDLEETYFDTYIVNGNSILRPIHYPPITQEPKAAERAGLTMKDIEMYEVNEAFAVVTMAFNKEHGLSEEIVNVNGGAMALGHPIGATGGMLIGTRLDELERQDKSTGLVTMCTGGGMGSATIIERV